MTGFQIANTLYEMCSYNRVHYEDVPSYIKNRIINLPREIQNAIEVYIRYNSFDRNIRDSDFDDNVKILRNYSSDEAAKYLIA